MKSIGTIIKEGEEQPRPDIITDPEYKTVIYKEFIHNVNKAIQIKNPELKFLMETDDDKRFVRTIINYFSRHEDFYKSTMIYNTKSLNKGLMLVGNCGVGKSLIMDTLSKMSKILGFGYNNFKMTTCNNIVARFDSKGQIGIEHFFTQAWCFDDLGTETEGSNYGKKADIIKQLIEERSYHFNQQGVKSHLTTNMTMEEIRKRYGVRVYDRLFEMFNIVVYTREKSFRQL